MIKTSKQNEPMTLICGLSPTNARCILSYCVTFMYICTCLLHTFSKRWFSYRGEGNLDYRCVYDVKNVICVKTGLYKRKVRLKMERIREKRKTT